MRFLFVISVVLSNALGMTAYALSPAVDGKNVVTGEKVEIPASNVVLVFLSAKCPCSNSHVSELAELSKTYPNYKFFGVHSNTDEDATLTKNYFVSAALPFPVIQDEGAKIADRYKAMKTPHAFVLDSEGRTAYRGGVSDSNEFEYATRKPLREALDDLKNGKTVKHPVGRPLGCSISRS